MQQPLVDMSCNPTLLSSLLKLIDSSPIDRKVVLIKLIVSDLAKQKGILTSNELVVLDLDISFMAILNNTFKKL